MEIVFLLSGPTKGQAWSALGEFRELLLGDVYQVHGS